jgi:hypothetical protein
MTDFMDNMLSQTSDGTSEGDLGVIPKDWSSESVYLVQFIGNTDCTEDPSVNDGLLCNHRSSRDLSATTGQGKIL